MRQKYLISKNVKRKELRVMEYAVIDKDLKKVASEHLRENNYTLVGKETYKSEQIVNAISQGKSALIRAIRTDNIFPISPYADGIAETIRELYKISENSSIELFFDDRDLFSVEPELE